jgi:hypothetical protein
LRNSLIGITALFLLSERPVRDVLDEKEEQLLLRDRIAIVVLLLLTKRLASY